MKLTHDIEAQKKGPEDKNDDKKGFGKSPLTEKLMGRIAAIFLAASAPAVIVAATTSSCVFQPAGIEAEQDGDTDAMHDGGPDSDADVDADSGHDSGPDADVDAGHDAGPDADVDADVDAGHDAGPDADVDADVDSGMDAGPDADVDAGPDADVDSGVDAGPDADVDAGPVACPGASLDSFSSVINISTPQTVGGYTFAYVGSAGGNTLFDITCGGSPIESGVVCPIGVLTIVDRTVPDGKIIQITSNSNAPTWTHTTIDVVNP